MDSLLRQQSCYCGSVAQRLFAIPWTTAYQASLSFTISQSLLKLMPFESVMPSNHLILCHPLLPLPSIFPSIRVFSNESALQIRWSKYWRFSFNICPCNEHSGYYLSKGLFLLWKEKNFLVVISVLWKLTYKVGFTLHTHTHPTHTYACMHTHTYTHTGYLTIALHIPKVKQEGKI